MEYRLHIHCTQYFLIPSTDVVLKARFHEYKRYLFHFFVLTLLGGKLPSFCRALVSTRLSSTAAAAQPPVCIQPASFNLYVHQTQIYCWLMASIICITLCVCHVLILISTCVVSSPDQNIIWKHEGRCCALRVFVFLKKKNILEDSFVNHLSVKLISIKIIIIIIIRPYYILTHPMGSLLPPPIPWDTLLWVHPFSFRIVTFFGVGMGTTHTSY